MVDVNSMLNMVSGVSDTPDCATPDGSNLDNSTDKSGNQAADSSAILVDDLVAQQSLSLADGDQVLSADLGNHLAPGEQLSIIVGEEVSGLTPEEQGVWTAASQELTLPGCYIYQCGGNTYRVTTYADTEQQEKPAAVPDVYTCEFSGCGRQFNALGYLKIHQLIHNGQKSTLVCPYKDCGRTFSWPAHLKYHQMTHIGKRPYACLYKDCGKSFYTSQRLMVHTRLHTGERPFVCQMDGCNKSFTTAGNLKNHVRIHSGDKPFACDAEGCSKRFTEYSSLRKHKIIHSGEKPFECVECGQPFTQSGSRNVHMRRHHSKDPSILAAISALADNISQPVTMATGGINNQITMATSDTSQDMTMANISDERIGASDISNGDIRSSLETQKNADDTDLSTLIIVQSGSEEVLHFSDQVVTVSTQPLHMDYQEPLSLSETLLSPQDDGITEDVIVKTEIEITNPEARLSSSNVVVLTQPQDMVSMVTDFHDNPDSAHEEIVYECDLLNTDLDHEEIFVEKM